MRFTLLLAVAFTVLGCAVPRVGGVRVANLNKWYIVSDPSLQRAAVPVENVAFFDKEPQDRKFKVIGFITPHPEAFKSYPEFVNAIRAAASLHGADAAFIDSIETNGSWKFSFNQWGGGGGSRHQSVIKAKAIVWSE